MNAINGSFTGRKRIRKSFGRIPEVAPMPNLIDVQRSSYEAFLQSDNKPDNRTHTGLQEVFKSVFPIDDFAGRGRLEFVDYELEEPKYDVEECIQRGMTYRAVEGDVASDRVGRRGRHRRALDQGHQGTARLLATAADDRHGTTIINGTGVLSTRRRIEARACSSITTRQDAFVGVRSRRG